MVRIVTDSTSDLSDQQAATLGIDAVAKLYVIFGDKTYQDGVTINNEQFYGLLKSNPSFPSTSQPSIGDFVKIYEKYKGDPIVSIHVSRDLSGTMASAEAARELVGGDITIIDSRNVNAGLALLVKMAVGMAKQGANVAQIKERVDAAVPRTRLIFTLETLENLRRGGRIGAAQALLGSVLNFKPIITVKDGRLHPVERVRTKAKAVARIRELALEELKGNTNPPIAFMHTANPDGVQQLADMCKGDADISDALIIEAGPVVATHAGPGAVGISYII
jgi:DegV family protein with EDD domain